MSENLKKQLVVIDGIIANAKEIVSSLSEEQEVLILSENNGLEEIKAYLAAKGTQYETIHFITHGSDGVISINGDSVTNEDLKSGDWAAIGSYLTDDGDFLFYSCELAKSDEGKRLIDAIAAAAGADAAASIDLTGADGDWELEYVSGSVASRTVTVAGYDGNLQTYTYENQTYESVVKTDHYAVINVWDGDNVTLTNCSFKSNVQAVFANTCFRESTELAINGNTARYEHNKSNTDGSTDSYPKQLYDRGSAISVRGQLGDDDTSYEYDNRNTTTINATQSMFLYNVAGTKYDIGSIADWETFYKEVKKNATGDSDLGLGGAIYDYLDCYGYVSEGKKYNKDYGLQNLYIYNAKFYWNSAIIKGGAIYGHRTWAHINNCFFSQNTAGLTSYLELARSEYGSSATIDATDDKGRGGAIAVMDSSWFYFETGTTFDRNHADEDGGAIYCSTPAEEKDYTFHILKRVIKCFTRMVKLAIPGPTGTAVSTAERVAKIAGKSAAKIAVKGSKNAIEEIIKYNGSVDDENKYHPIMPEVYFQKDADFTTNKALNGDGGALAVKDHGIALFKGKASYSYNTAGEDGGAVYIDDHSICITQEETVCKNNSAGGYGGAFCIHDISTAHFGENATFSCNSAREYGGAIYASGLLREDEDDPQTTVETGDAVFESNTASSGGACHLEYLNAYFCGDVIFRDNVANGHGTSISGNGNGGALDIYTNYSGLVDSADFVTNGVAFYGSVLFSGNSAKVYGGGLYVCAWNAPSISSALYSSYFDSPEGKVIFYKDVTFSGNTAASGNAMYIAPYAWVRFSGDMNLEENQTVHVCAGGFLEWDIVRDGDKTACVSDYSLISYAQNESIVSGTSAAARRYILLNDRETAGKTSYILAENAAGAKDQIFSIRTVVGLAEYIKVGGDDVTYGDYTYRLAVNISNQLVLSVVGGVGKESAVDVSGGTTFYTDGWFEDYTSGAFSVASDGILDLYDATFKNCSTSGNGGAILNNGGTVYLDNVTFSGNAGGAILNCTGGTIELVGEVTLATGTDYITNYGNLEWAINQVKHGYLSDFSKINNGTGYSYSITLDPSECLLGSYKLASNAANADKNIFTINVFDTDTDDAKVTSSVTITVNGGVVKVDERYVWLYTDENNDLWCGVNEHMRTVVDSVYTISGEQQFDKLRYGGDGGAFCVNALGMLNNTASISFTNCSATGKGGAIYNNGGTVSLSNAVFSNNRASSGGAIENKGTLRLNNVTFCGNTVTEGTLEANGGAILNWGTLELDGSVWIAADSDYISNNGKLEWVITSSTHGFLSDYSMISNGSGGSYSISIDSSECIDCYKIASNAVHADGATFTVSGIGSTESVTLTVNGESQTLGDLNVLLYLDYKYDLYFIARDSTIKSRIVVSSDYSQSSYNSFDNWSYDGDGAVFYVTNSGNFNSNASRFTNCSATGNGGVVCSTGNCTITNSNFTGNYASGNGGAVYSTGNCTINDVLLTGNSASNGGAIYSTGNCMINNGGVFIGNSASGNGGAVYSAGNTTIDYIVFSGNSASGNGGALYVASGSTVSLASDVLFDGNTASGQGNAIYIAPGGVLNVDDGGIILKEQTDTFCNDGILNWNLHAYLYNMTPYIKGGIVSGNGKFFITVQGQTQEIGIDYILKVTESSSPSSGPVKPFISVPTKSSASAPVLMMAASPALTTASGNEEKKRQYTIRRESGDEIGTLSANNVLVYGDRVYHLKNVNGKLSLHISVADPVVRGDLDGNRMADILMTLDQSGHAENGRTGAWLMQADTATWDELDQRGENWTLFGTGRTSFKTASDIYLKSDDNIVGAWVTDDSGQVVSWQTIECFDADTQILGLGDFNGDGKSDLLLRNVNGAVGSYLTDGTGWNYFQSLGNEWKIAGIGDLNGDGRSDVILKHDAGFAGSWLSQEDGTVVWADLDTLPDVLEIAGCGDFNGDGTDDVLIKCGNYYGAWLVKDGSVSSWMGLGSFDATVETISDLNGDGVDDLRVRTASGDIGAQLVMGEDTLLWNYYGSVGDEWKTKLASL